MVNSGEQDGFSNYQPPSPDRNARARHQVESLLEQFHEQTERLAEVRQEVAALTAELTSKDRLVTVTVDAAGMVSDLRIAPAAFDRTTPAALGRTIADLVRRAVSQVREDTQDLMSPFTDAMPDLGGLTEAVPELGDLAATMRDLTGSAGLGGAFGDERS